MMTNQRLSLPIIALAVFAASIATPATPTPDVELPKWRIADICENDSAAGYCRVAENNARNSVSGNWPLLPPDWRKACLATIKAPLEPSWRLLGECLEARMVKARQDKEVANRRDSERILAKILAANQQANLKAEAAAAKKKANEKALQDAEAAAKKKAEEAARLAAEAAAKKKAEEAARLAAEAAAKKKAEEAARLAAEAAAKKKAEEAARLAAAAAAKKKAEEAARLAAEAAAKKKAEEAARAALKLKRDKACAEKLKKTLAKGIIRFRFNSARLSKKSNPTLNKIVETMNSCPTSQFLVEGHTDSIGDASYNLRLSSARAKSVADYLIKAGVAENRIKSRGFGETRPRAKNNTRKNRAKNRRIEFSLWK